jgi:hypothetical protein
MASHPYISGAGNIAQMIQHLRKSFPQNVTSETVKKLGLAPKNESYVINAIQFIGIIDEEGKKTDAGQRVFSNHKDDDFKAKFGELVATAYGDLFELHGEQSWQLSKDDLVQFFRTADNTSDAIGQRQASVFRTFASIAGHLAAEDNGDSSKPISKSKPVKKSKPATAVAVTAKNPLGQNTAADSGNIGLTIRIEINLPAGASKEDYDNIFKSLRSNIIDA